MLNLIVAVAILAPLFAATSLIGPTLRVRAAVIHAGRARRTA